MFPNLFWIYSKLTTIFTVIVHVTHKLARTPIGKSEAIYQTFTYIVSLACNFLSGKIPTDVSYICFKNIAKLDKRSNNLPQIRLNV